jgi:CRISPR-associated protein Csm5
MNIGRTLKAELEVLSPLHVNSGRGELLEDYDFVAAGKEICVIDSERLLCDMPLDKWVGRSTAAKISQLIGPEQYSDYARYKLRMPAGVAHVLRIMDCVKDAHGNPYIPGSSIKGAIRTALAWAMLMEEKIQVDQRDLGYNPRYADAPLMARLFGTDPNHDILRCLHVSDTKSLAPDNIELTPVALYTMGRNEPRRLEPKGQGYRFNLEALRTGVRIAGTIRFDDFLLQRQEASQLGFGKRTHYVENFVRYCNGLARAVIQKEIAYYGRYGPSEVKQFYSTLADAAERIDMSCESLLQMSWGTGWTSKTVGTALPPELLKQIRSQFRLDRGREGEPIFPKTRRLVERGGGPVMVPGWLKLKLVGP